MNQNLITFMIFNVIRGMRQHEAVARRHRQKRAFSLLLNPSAKAIWKTKYFSINIIMPPCCFKKTVNFRGNAPCRKITSQDFRGIKRESATERKKEKASIGFPSNFSLSSTQNIGFVLTTPLIVFVECDVSARFSLVFYPRYVRINKAFA